MSQDPDTSDRPSRRQIIRSLGAAGATTGGLSMLSRRSRAAASPGQVRYREIPSRRARRQIRWFTRRPEFHRLAAETRSRGFDADLDDALVGHVRGEGVDRTLMSVPLSGTDKADAHLTLAVSESGEIEIATLEFAESERLPTDLTKIDVLDGMETHREHVPDPRATGGFRPADVSKDAVTIQADIGCTGCTTAVGLICQIGCHAGTAFICGVLTGAGYIAGAACFAFARYACALISIYGCGGQFDYNQICSDMGYC